jgi:hypothetical protein
MSSLTATEIVDKVETLFNDQWTSTPVAYENALFTIPETDPWIRVTVNFFNSDQGGIGTDCVYLRGQIIVQIFTRYDTGTRTSYQLADEISALIQNTDLGGLLTYAASILKIGDAERSMNRMETDWYQMNVYADFDTT